ncbi:MAG: hypothetical protein ABR878_09795 [Roseiarcus sp.]
MSKITRTVLLLGGVLGLSALAVPAFADNVSYCRDYARDAVHQSRAARDHERCHHFIRDNPARFSEDYNGHYTSCMSNYGSGFNAAENQARIDALNDCIPDHHW